MSRGGNLHMMFIMGIETGAFDCLQGKTEGE